MNVGVRLRQRVVGVRFNSRMSRLAGSPQGHLLQTTLDRGGDAICEGWMQAHDIFHQIFYE